MSTQDVTFNDLNWKIEYDPEKCTMCGSCVAACTFDAIEVTVERRDRTVSREGCPTPVQEHVARAVIRQKNGTASSCSGCGMCEKICPNKAIHPVRNPDARTPLLTRGKGPVKRGGRKNVHAVRTLDSIIVGRISQMTDPALDSERHTFDVRAPLGRVLPVDSLPLGIDGDSLVLRGHTPPVRWIYPLIFSDMSIGALSTRAWEALTLAVAYLNEKCNIPIRMSSGEGGMPIRLLESEQLKYMIIQIASGHFGWDRIIRAMPHMKEDPCAVLIKIGQGAKPGDGGLLPAAKVGPHISAIRGVPKALCIPRPTIRTCTPLRSPCRKCISPSMQPLASVCPWPSSARPPRRPFRCTTTSSAIPTISAADSLSTACRAARVQPMRSPLTTPAIPSSPSSVTAISLQWPRAVRDRFPCGAAAASA